MIRRNKRPLDIVIRDLLSEKKIYEKRKGNSFRFEYADNKLTVVYLHGEPGGLKLYTKNYTYKVMKK